MKSVFITSFLFLSLIVTLSSCKDGGENGEGEMSEPKIFATSDEAAAQAKDDIIRILETNEDIDLGIDINQLKNSTTGRLVRFTDIDFSRLLSTPEINNLSEISTPPKGMIAPYILENNVVGVAAVGKVTDGWKIIGLGDQPITSDLNTTGVMYKHSEPVTIYEVPNLQLNIYGVMKETAEIYYLEFNDFSLRDTTRLEAFYPLLRESAIRFQEEFGERLKKEKLVK